MDTTKLIVEYLIAGILICIAVLFLMFNVSPNEMGVAFSALTQAQSFNTTGLVIIILPIAYALGMLGEYFGMVIYESTFEKIKKARFPIFVEQNQDWLLKTPLFKYNKNQKYGEMRSFIIMHSLALYSEIERYLNQLRILRALTIIEFLFLLAAFFHLIKQGIDLLAVSGLIILLFLLMLNIRAISHRFTRYCEAVESSFKVLSLEKDAKQSGKRPEN